MVSKGVVLFGTLLVLAGAACTIMISILEEWVIVVVPGDDNDSEGVEAACAETPLGSLGLFTATYNPECVEGKINPTTGEPYAYTMFNKTQSPTTKFWPLFPAQAKFDNFFSDDTPEFDSCESYLAADGAGIQVAEEYVDRTVISPAFVAVDAGLGPAAMSLRAEVTPTLEMVDRLIPTLFLGTALEIYEGINETSISLTDGLAGIEAGLNGVLAAFATSLDFSASIATDITTQAGHLKTAGILADDTGVTSYPALMDKSKWNVGSFIAAGICGAVYTAGSADYNTCVSDHVSEDASAPFLAVYLEQKAGTETLLDTMGGMYAPASPASPFTEFVVNGVSYEFDTANGCITSLLDCASVGGVADANALTDFSTVQKFMKRAAFLQLAGTLAADASLFDLSSPPVATVTSELVVSTNEDLENLISGLTVFLMCTGKTSLAECADPADGVEGLNGIPTSLTATWNFCLLASGSVLEGLVNETAFGGCNVMATLTGLGQGLAAGSVNLTDPEAAAALEPAIPLIPLLLNQFAECADVGLTWDQTYRLGNATLGYPLSYPINVTHGTDCQASFMNPGLFSSPATEYDQQLIAPVGAGAWTTVRYGLCFAVQKAQIVRTGSFMPCATFQDFLQQAAVEGALGDPLFESFVVFYGGLVSACEGVAELAGAAVLGSPICEQTLVGLSGASAVPFALLALENFYGGINTSATDTDELIQKCLNQEEDARRIGMAQTLIPAAIGLEGVAVLLALVAALGNKKALSIIGGILGLAGCGLTLGSLLMVQGAPVYQGVGGECAAYEACYQGGLATTLGLVSIATPLVGGLLILGGSFCGGAGKEVRPE